jgi:hypothetical protein
MDYLSMVMMFYFNIEERIIYIHNWMENFLEVHLMDDYQEEEDHLINTHLKDHCLIHLFDFIDGWHPI